MGGAWCGWCMVWVDGAKCFTVQVASGDMDILFLCSFGPSEKEVLFVEEMCKGSELRWKDCLVEIHHSNTCNHTRDVGLTCGECRRKRERVKEGQRRREGEVSRKMYPEQAFTKVFLVI